MQTRLLAARVAIARSSEGAVLRGSFGPFKYQRLIVLIVAKKLSGFVN